MCYAPSTVLEMSEAGASQSSKELSYVHSSLQRKGERDLYKDGVKWEKKHKSSEAHRDVLALSRTLSKSHSFSGRWLPNLYVRTVLPSLWDCEDCTAQI